MARYRHGGIWLHARTGAGPHRLAGAPVAGHGARHPGAAAVLAGRLGLAGAGHRTATRAGRAHPVHCHVGAHAVGHLAWRVLAGTQPWRATRGLRVRWRGTARRLCLCHGRWRPAGLAGLPGSGTAFARGDLVPDTTVLHDAGVFCPGGGPPPALAPCAGLGGWPAGAGAQRRTHAGAAVRRGRRSPVPAGIPLRPANTCRCPVVGPDGGRTQPGGSPAGLAT